MIATIVGGIAPMSKPRGAIACSGKCFFKIEIPAGFGAFAITVRPPPVTAPATSAILNSSDNPSTSDQRYVRAALSVIAGNVVAPKKTTYELMDINVGSNHHR